MDAVEALWEAHELRRMFLTSDSAFAAEVQAALARCQGPVHERLPAMWAVLEEYGIRAWGERFLSIQRIDRDRWGGFDDDVEALSRHETDNYGPTSPTEDAQEAP